jgi:hypothetical protein
MHRILRYRWLLSRKRFSTSPQQSDPIVELGQDAINSSPSTIGMAQQPLVKSPRYFGNSGMVKPFERPSMLVMGFTSILAMFAGTFIMDYLYFEHWVKQNLTIMKSYLIFVVTICQRESQ